MTTPSATDLDNNIFFTHTTSVIPFGGRMIPGRKMLAGTGDPELPVPPDRFTLHWFPQHFIALHEGWSRENDSYYIIEPAKCVKSILYGGYAEDFMTLGYHELSDESVILVPTEREQVARQTLYPGFKGRISCYTDRNDAERQLAEHIASKTTNFKFRVPPNQKETITVSIQALIHLMKDPQNGLSQAECQTYKQAIREALSENPSSSSVNLQANVPPLRFQAEFNDNPVNARQFFSAWEQQGLYFGSHEDSLFKELELISIFLMGQALMHPDSLAQEEEAIQQLTATAKKIKELLIARQFPLPVQEYFRQKIEIDLLSHWLPLLKEMDGSTSFAEKKEQLIRMTSAATTLSMQQIQRTPDYEPEAIEQQSIACALSAYSRTTFFAYKRKGGELLDAKARVADSDAAQRLHHQLKVAGIHSYFKGEEVIVPDINTAMVANATRQAMNS